MTTRLTDETRSAWFQHLGERQASEAAVTTLNRSDLSEEEMPGATHE